MYQDHLLSAAATYASYITGNPLYASLATTKQLLKNISPKFSFSGIPKLIYTDVETKKYDAIREIIDEMALEHGLDPKSINFRVSNALGSLSHCEGSPFSITSPVLYLSASLLRNYKNEQLEADPNFEKWMQFLNDLPNNPFSIERFLRTCPQREFGEASFLVQKFSDYVSEKEIRAIIGSQIGQLKGSKSINETAIDFSTKVLDVMFAEATAHVARDSISRGSFDLEDLFIHYFLIPAIFGGVSTGLSTLLKHIVNSSKEALSCTSSKETLEGFSDAAKKNVLKTMVYWLNDPSIFAKKQKNGGSFRRKYIDQDTLIRMHVQNATLNEAQGLREYQKVFPSIDLHKSGTTYLDWGLAAIAVAGFAHSFFYEFSGVPQGKFI